MRGSMHLQVVTPGAIVVDQPVDKVIAEAKTGHFALLPRHIDYATVLVPGLLDYFTDDGEHLMAVAGGVLVKRGESVRVATSEATAGDNLVDLQRELRASFAELAEDERRSRATVAHLETDAIRRLIGLSDHD